MTNTNAEAPKLSQEGPSEPEVCDEQSLIVQLQNLEHTGDRAELVTLLRRIHESGGYESVNILTKSAALWRKYGAPEMAARCLHRATELAPANVELRLQYINLLRNLEGVIPVTPAEVDAEYQRLLPTNDGRVLWSVADWHYRRGEFADAVTYFEQIVPGTPHYARALHRRANCAKSQGKYARAEELYCAAIDAAGADSVQMGVSMHGLAQLYIEWNRKRVEAHFLLDSAMILGMPWAYYTMGLWHEKYGRRARAVRYYRQFLFGKPDLDIATVPNATPLFAELRQKITERRQATAAAPVPLGTVLEGTVRRTNPYGAFVDLGWGVNRYGFVQISELANWRVRDVAEVMGEGDRVQLRVIGMDEKRRRLLLSMRGMTPPKAARDERNASMDDLLRKYGKRAAHTARSRRAAAKSQISPELQAALRRTWEYIQSMDE